MHELCAADHLVRVRGRVRVRVRARVRVRVRVRLRARVRVRVSCAQSRTAASLRPRASLPIHKARRGCTSSLG